MDSLLDGSLVVAEVDTTLVVEVPQIDQIILQVVTMAVVVVVVLSHTLFTVCLLYTSPSPRDRG